MVEPIPFYGLFDDSSSPETYLREQIHAQQSIINTLSKNVIDLQSEIIKLQGNLDRMALPNLWHAKDFGWETGSGKRTTAAERIGTGGCPAHEHRRQRQVD